MTKITALGVGGLCFVLSACCVVRAEPPAVADAPPRLPDGRLAPTEAKLLHPYTNEAERLKLIEKAEAHRVEITGKFPPPVFLCKRVADGSITIDGKLDDAGWKGLMPLTSFRGAYDPDSVKHKTRAMIAWDSKYLYVAFDGEDPDIVSTHTAHDADLWAEDAVEVFIDANGDGMSYIELEVSARNVIYDAALADYRPEVDWADRKDMLHLDMVAATKNYTLKASKTAVHVDGTVNDSSDTDRGWSCEMAIAWSDISRGTNITHLPPQDGDHWRMTLCHVNFNPKDKSYELGILNPTLSWYHVPWCFPHVIFVK